MPFIQLSKISLAFGDRDILKDITLILTAGTKAALTGANGCGKSTLMKIVAGQIKADSGDIARKRYVNSIPSPIGNRPQGQDLGGRGRNSLCLRLRYYQGHG